MHSVPLRPCVFVASVIILLLVNAVTVATTRLDDVNSRHVSRTCPLCPECHGCHCWNLTVNCARTNLTHVPDMSPEVQDLNFGYNQLERLDASTFRGLSHLRKLNLEYNKISYIEPGVFENMSSLLRLSLRGNPLQKLDDFAFSPLSNLTFIDLSYVHASFNAMAFVNVTSLSTANFESN